MQCLVIVEYSLISDRTFDFFGKVHITLYKPREFLAHSSHCGGYNCYTIRTDFRVLKPIPKFQMQNNLRIWLKIANYEPLCFRVVTLCQTYIVVQNR